jgi:hypothetical protein
MEYPYSEPDCKRRKQTMKLLKPASLVIAALAVALVAAPAISKQKPPATWDGLELTPRKGLDLVYLRPGAQFKGYTNVMIDDPVEVAFDKNWDPNENVRSLSRRMSEDDIQKIRSEMAVELRKVFIEELTKGGYAVVDKPGAETLRVRAGLADVYINAPDRQEPGRVTYYTMESGRMTLVMELRDGPTGQLLSRVIDQKVGGDMGTLQMTNSVTNSADFRRAVRAWADRLVKGLDKVNGKAD